MTKKADTQRYTATYSHQEIQPPESDVHLSDERLTSPFMVRHTVTYTAVDNQKRIASKVNTYLTLEQIYFR